jgi:oligosaccharide repeat unit polymerase
LINPLSVFILLWSVCLIIVESGIIKYHALNSKFYTVFFTAFFFFSLGYSLISFISRFFLRRRNHCRYVVRDTSNIIRFFFSAVIIIITLSIFNFYDKVGNSFDLGLYRSLITDESEQVKLKWLYGVLNPFAFLALPMLLVLKATRGQIYKMSMLLVLFAGLSTGRAPFLVVALILFWYLYLTEKINKKIILIIVISFLIFFASMGVLLGKLSNDVGIYMFNYVSDDIPFNWFTVAFVNILTYTTSGIVAFSEFISESAPTYEMYYTGKNFYKVFGIIFTSPDYGILPNMYVPFPTNVYTFLFPIYADFGFYGISIVFFIYGGLGGFLFAAYRIYRSEFLTLLLSIYFTILILSVFHDYMFSSLFPYTCFLVLFMFKKVLNRRL